MAKITYPTKNTGDQFFASEANEIKTSVNVNVDAIALNTAKVTNVSTNLSYTAAPTIGTVTSSDGTNATLTLADVTNAGLLTPADFTILSNTSGTNTGDQTSIVGITGTKAQFDTAVTDGNILYVGDAPTSHTHVEVDITDLGTYSTDIHGNIAALDAVSGTNTGDQSTIVGITGTMAQFDTAVTDGNIMYIGDAPTSHTHALAAGATDVNATAGELNILDLSATALTTGWGYFADGASAASWRKLLGSEITNDSGWTADQTTIVGITGTMAQFDTAVTDGNIMYIGDAPTSHTHLLAAGATDVDATAAELNVLDLSATALTIGWVYAADGASAASWRKLLGSEITNDSSWAADQTSIVGIGGTKAQFNTECSDGTFLYVGDVTTNQTHTGDVTGSGALTIAAGAVDIAMLSATGSPDNTNFLRGDNVWATPAGSGDMVLASAQTNSGVKTFLDTTMKLRNVANTFDGYFVNTNTADRIYTLQDSAGTIAFTSDITGTNSGTNTGDQTTIVGITGTKAQFDTAVSDGNIMYIGDAPTSHTHTESEITDLGTYSTDIHGNIVALDAVSGTNTGDEAAASLTVVGVVELATIAETNTGTDATRAVTPDGLDGWTGSAQVVTLGTIATGTWQGTAINQTYLTGQSGTNTGDQTITLTGDVTGTGTGSFATTIAVDAVDIAMLSATGSPDNTNFLRGDNTWATPAGSGDMVLANAQTNSGIKTFLDTTMKLRNVANTFDGYFVNTNTANRIYTLQDSAGTVAFTSDITGTNSGTNTGDQTTIVGITGTKAQFDTAVTDGNIMYDGDAPTAHTHPETALTGLRGRGAVTIVDPVAGDDATLFYTEVAITVTSVNSHITGTTNVVYNINHAATRDGTGLDVFSSDITLTTVSGQTNNSGFNDATIPANSWVWLDVVSVSGSPTMFHATVNYTED